MNDMKNLTKISIIEYKLLKKIRIITNKIAAKVPSNILNRYRKKASGRRDQSLRLDSSK
jgi:hypothetical protein